MKLFHSDPVPFQTTRDKNRIIVENQYIRCIHDLEHGGELSEAVIKNGTGKNLFTSPQSTVVGIIENGAYHCYRSSNSVETECMISERNGNPVLEFHCGLTDDSGKVIDDLKMDHRVEYTHWGEGLHRITLNASQRIENLGMVQIGTLFPSYEMDTLAVQDAQIQSPYPYCSNVVKNWLELKKGNQAAYLSRWLPVSMLVMKRGWEGFQFILGDQLTQWESIGGTLPGFQMGYFAWNRNSNSYEMRFSALDCRRDGQYLEGTNPFEFSLAFPFVRKKILPLSPCSGNIFNFTLPFEKRWPDDNDFMRLEKAGVHLMRLHNDADIYNNGIFWRDAAYPPYPPEEMAKMDDMLRRAHARHIAVVPYFSLHECHPEAAGFSENAEIWGRIAASGDGIIPNYCRNGYYGFQMCLHSGWFQKRIDTIDEVLRHHAFDGVYYDWCGGIECLNPKHGRHHRDHRRLLELLEWSHTRVGDNGALYLHLTHKPNIAAENMASLVLTEECGGSVITPEMFTPHAHFMNIVPRQVCCMLPANAPDADHRRYALCALLHHATVSSMDKVYTDFYREYHSVLALCSTYSRHSAPGEGLCFTSNPNIGMSAYWNQSGEKMFLFVNLSRMAQTSEYSFMNNVTTGSVSLDPLSLKKI